MQGLPLCQTRTDEQSQIPQALGLGDPTPEWSAAFKFELEFMLKPDLKVWVMLGGAQQTVNLSDQGDMAFNRLEVPQLILVQPFGLAFFMIDFNGPAVAPDTGDARSLPPETVG